MDAYERGLEVVERLNDPELTELYQAYTTRIESLLSPEERELYTSYQQRMQSSSAPLPEEQAAADKVVADPELQPLYERYLARLASRQSGTGVARTRRVRVYGA